MSLEFAYHLFEIDLDNHSLSLNPLIPGGCLDWLRKIDLFICDRLELHYKSTTM